MEVSGQRHASSALYPRKNPHTLWIGGCVNPRADLDVLEKRNISAFTKIRAPDRLARQQKMSRNVSKHDNPW
jgi:hypothetical protein